MHHFRVRFALPTSHDVEKEKLANGYYIPFNYHSDIDEEYVEKVFHIKDDGWCGFRAIAALVMDNQDLYSSVKKKMLKKLTDNEEFYKEHVCLKSEEELNTLKERMEYQKYEHSCPREYWFEGSTDFQLAADTFGVPIAIYTVDRSGNIPPTLHLPLLTPKYKALPLVLHHINGNHFIAIQMKKKHQDYASKYQLFYCICYEKLGELRYKHGILETFKFSKREKSQKNFRRTRIELK